jgi:two-component system OmpR family response regulator
MMHILVIEDDQTQSAYLKKGLTELGHQVSVAEDGKVGLVWALNETFDFFIIDRMIPGIDGLSLLKSIRAAGVSTPVIFLTALGSVDNRVEGLRAGSDDYMTKPFSMEELAARIDALARRPAIAAVESSLVVGDLKIDLLSRVVTRAGTLIDLQPKEYALLEALIRADGRVLTRSMLLEKVWGFQFDPMTSVLETHISRLRAKIDKPFESPLIHTVRQVGYRLHASH